MEDAHITKSPLTDKKNSLFAVFDGHGGKFDLIFRSWSIKICWETFRTIVIGQSKL